jgi:signal transduction histidine kinase
VSSAAPGLTPEEIAVAVSRAAHDLDNLCASILGFAALAQESLPGESPEQLYLAEVQAAAEKTAALAGHLRDLSRALRTPQA